MEIIAHRGFWKTVEEQNQLIAIERAFNNNFGVEIDLREKDGNIVISHDFPVGQEISLENVLQALKGRNLPLALNIKTDGMGKLISKVLKKYNHTNYFTFDMSIPEMVVQNKLGLRFYTGLSDIISNPIMYDEAAGIWLDSFYKDWYNEDVINKIIFDKKKVCIVSPELHGREYIFAWNKYRHLSVALCTDYPLEARGFFNE